MADRTLTIDASAIIAVLVNEASKPDLLIATAGRALVAPGSIIWEVGNAFSAMLKRRSLSLRASLKALEIFSGLPIRYVDVSIQESLQIAGDLGLYAYDAYLLVCARTFNAPLITLDRGLRKAAAGLGVKVVSF